MNVKIININASIKMVLDLLSSYPLLFIINDRSELVASLSNGDLRRALKNGIDIMASVETIMNKKVIFSFETDSIEIKLSKISELPREYAFLPIVRENLSILAIVTRQTLTQKRNKVVLMAGGLGSRLGELTKNIPKPLLQIGSKPILEIIINGFKASHFNDFIIAVNYKGGMIKEFFGDGAGSNSAITYVHENKRMGTAGALSLIDKSEFKEPFFVMNGDVLTDENFEEILEYHSANGFEATMCVFEHEFTIPYGVVESDVKNNLTSIIEKPVKKFNVNAGIYVLNATTLSYVLEDEYLDMPNLFQRIKDDKKKIGVYEMKTSWIDIGLPSDYKLANQ